MAADSTPPARRGGAAGAVAVLLLVLAAVSLITAVVLPVNQLTQPGGAVSVGLTPASLDDVLRELDGLPAGVALSVDAEGTRARLDVAELDGPLRVLTELPASLRGLCTAAGALLLWQLLTSIRGGRPFDRRNPRRLVLLAAAVLVGGVGGQLLEAVSRLAVLDAVGSRPGGLFDLGAGVDLTAAVLGVLLLALAEAFRSGVMLAEDVQGLV